MLLNNFLILNIINSKLFVVYRWSRMWQRRAV